MLTGIIGGGLAGVSLRYFLEHDCEVLEKEERPGGLCRTFHADGFSYDIGGHILFSKDRALMDIFSDVLGENINHCRRNNQILYKDRYLKYPFENGLGKLDREDIYECLIGYLVNEHPEPRNFKEWIYHVFGSGIAEKYLVPYNEKIWKVPLEEIGLEWVERVPRPPVEDIVKSALDIETEGYIHQLNFCYPAVGGIEALIGAFSDEGARVTTGFEVRRIDRRDGGWVVSDGRDEKFYDKLVLTMPVKEAVKHLSGVPDKVLDAAAALRYNSVRVVLVGVNNESLMDKSAIYIPDPDVLPHRICFMGFFSKSMVPDGLSSLIAEVTSPGGVLGYDIPDAELAKRVVDDLHRIGIIDKRDVVVVDVKNMEYGYVIDDRYHVKNKTIIRDYFDSIGIILHGRFAEFEYINMDEVIRRSVEMASRLDATQ